MIAYKKKAEDWANLLGYQFKIRISRYSVVSLHWHTSHLVEIGDGYAIEHPKDKYISIAPYFRVLESSREALCEIMPMTIRAIVEEYAPCHDLGVRCACPIQVVVAVGCKCGAFDKENSAAYLGKKKFI